MGFIDRIVNSWELFTTSFDFIRRDNSLLITPLIMFLSFFIFGILAIPIALFIFVMPGVVQIISCVFFLLVVHTWFTFLGAAHSWMVHEVAQGKDTTFGSGLQRAAHNFPDILLYAVVFFLISTFISFLRSKTRYLKYATGWLSLLSGVIGRLILPAMIVTERSFGEAVGQLKDSIDALPEIATYEFGIRPVLFLSTIIAIGLAFLIGSLVG